MSGVIAVHREIKQVLDEQIARQASLHSPTGRYGSGVVPAIKLSLTLLKLNSALGDHSRLAS
jgi:hypothetical protein